MPPPGGSKQACPGDVEPQALGACELGQEYRIAEVGGPEVGAAGIEPLLPERQRLLDFCGVGGFTPEGFCHLLGQARGLLGVTQAMFPSHGRSASPVNTSKSVLRAKAGAR